MPYHPEFLRTATRTQAMVHYHAVRVRRLMRMNRRAHNPAVYEFHLLQEHELKRWTRRRRRQERESRQLQGAELECWEENHVREERLFNWRRDHDLLAMREAMLKAERRTVARQAAQERPPERVGVDHALEPPASPALLFRGSASASPEPLPAAQVQEPPLPAAQVQEPPRASPVTSAPGTPPLEGSQHSYDSEASQFEYDSDDSCNAAGGCGHFFLGEPAAIARFRRLCIRFQEQREERDARPTEE